MHIGRSCNCSLLWRCKQAKGKRTNDNGFEIKNEGQMSGQFASREGRFELDNGPPNSFHGIADRFGQVGLIESFQVATAASRRAPPLIGHQMAGIEEVVEDVR